MDYGDADALHLKNTNYALDGRDKFYACNPFASFGCSERTYGSVTGIGTHDTKAVPSPTPRTPNQTTLRVGKDQRQDTPVRKNA